MLIEDDLVPDDVWIQVLTQSRPELIERTYESIEGARNAIVHLYNPTSTLQRRVVYGLDLNGIIDIALTGTRQCRELREKRTAPTFASNTHLSRSLALKLISQWTYASR